MSTLSALIKNGQQIQMRSGLAQLNPNDLVQVVEPSGYVYPVGTIDYDTTQTTASIVPQTAIDSTPENSTIYHRHSVITDFEGSIYVGQAGTANDAKVCKLTGSGVRVFKRLVGLDATRCINMHIASLGNGNIVSTFYRVTAQKHSFAIIDKNGTVVVPSTDMASSIESGAGSTPSHVAYHSMIPLASGGFAVAFQNSGGTAVQLATYDQTGSLTLAPTTIQTLTGTAAVVWMRMGQLLNGNLVVAMRSPTTAGPNPEGTTFVIVTTAGVSVKTNTVVDNLTAVPYITGLVQCWPELNILGNNFAIGGLTGTGNTSDPQAYLATYDATGTLQGSKYLSSSSTASGSGIGQTTFPQCCLLNDGTKFWMAYAGATLGGGNQGSLVSMTLAGVATEYGALIPFASGPVLPADGNSSADMALIGGNFAIFQSPAAGANVTTAPFVTLWPMPDQVTGSYVPLPGTTTTIGSAAATRGALVVKIVPTGLSAIFAYDNQNAANMFIAANKLFNSAIIGINQGGVGPASPGVLTGVNVGATNAPINPIPATAEGVLFDHSAGTPHGNKGRLYRAGVLQTGL